MSVKIERISSEVGREISSILLLEAKDETLKHITVTGCEVTNDLSYARVYFTVFDKEKKDDVLDALNNASSFIRGCLADRIEIRHTPELKFIYDTSEEYGEHIDKIISDLKDK